MPISSRAASVRARIAAKKRHHPDRPDLIEDERELKVALAEEYLEKVVSSWPPLTDDQRARLAGLLHPASNGDSDAA